jgi:Uma2 family endonuclease
MLTVEKKKKYTDADYMLLEEGAPFQLINYDLVMSPSPNTDHQTISFRIAVIVGIFLEKKNDNGYVASAPCDVKFDDGNVLQPDLLYISEERKIEIVKERIIGAPDMVVEILSPSNAYYDLRQKKDIYQKYGVKEYIIVDPVLMNADLYALKDGIYYLHQRAEKTELLHSLVLPGLSFDMNKIFK